MEHAARQRVVIDRVEPEVDAGRHPIKRVVGEEVVVEAVAVADGHDRIECRLLYRRDDPAGEVDWEVVEMRPGTGDRFIGRIPVESLGRYLYTVEANIDRYGTWRNDLLKKAEAHKPIALDLSHGLRLLADAADRADPDSKPVIEERRSRLAALADRRTAEHAELLDILDEDLRRAMMRHGPRLFVTRYERELPVMVEPKKARFSTWYELFPRSASRDAGRHGTFADVIERLPYVARMGFDVLYLPPIHPIGRTHRKGKNNQPVAEAGDVGSPWGIGAAEGGHRDIHPDLGGFDDLERLLEAATKHGIDVALDLAFQCSPDHPYVNDHPEWFKHREDGTIQCAENPPKVYEDIYPIDFETEAHEALWQELLGVVRFWIDQGITIFRVDNPHTKPFNFWEWLIREVKQEHPEVIFLAEAFARPAVMYRLAKIGFSQSYNYFPWKNTKWELAEYYSDITQGEVREYFRPSSWPNTPDILNEYLQFGGRPAFVIRQILAATISASYGIYGPAFELCDARPRQPGSEEYLDSEKYQIRHWDLDAPHSLKELIARVNRIRREHPALQRDWGLVFHRTSNDQVLCYSKSSADREDVILVVINLDPHHRHSAWLDLDLGALGVALDQTFQVHDLLSDARFLWRGSRSYVELDPAESPAHVFSLLRRVRRAQDFEYFV